MYNVIVGKYFLQDGFNTTESPEVFYCAPVSPKPQFITPLLKTARVPVVSTKPLSSEHYVDDLRPLDA